MLWESKEEGGEVTKSYGHPKSNGTGQEYVSSCMMTPIKMLSYGLCDHYHYGYQSNRDECFPCYNVVHK